LRGERSAAFAEDLERAASFFAEVTPLWRADSELPRAAAFFGAEEASFLLLWVADGPLLVAFCGVIWIPPMDVEAVY
jgi:hypothetical protein